MRLQDYRKCYIPANSPLCRKGILKPGEHWVLYEGGDRIKIRKGDDINTEYETVLSGLDLLVLLAQSSKLEGRAREILIRKNRSAGGGYINHHVIPVHFFQRSELIVTATKLGLTNLAKDPTPSSINLNSGENIIRVTEKFHRKAHGPGTKYSNTVGKYLKDRWEALIERGCTNDPEELQSELSCLIDIIRDELKAVSESSSSSSIGNFGMTYEEIIEALQE